ncbi:hypothetical protein QJQ45_018617 [Haematococcus lacustris]|nr:hypothetical protein QJQ45_018617 [Haematococcus lacustris]
MGHEESSEHVLRTLGRCLVLPVVDGRYRTPVVTIHSAEHATSNLYVLIERQLKEAYALGAEKFWKLKALANCRLPEQPEEFAAVEHIVESIKYALKAGSLKRSAPPPLCHPTSGMKSPQGMQVLQQGLGGHPQQLMQMGSTPQKKAHTGGLPGVPGLRAFDELSSQQATLYPPQGLIPYCNYSDTGCKEPQDELGYQGNGTDPYLVAAQTHHHCHHTVTTTTTAFLVPLLEGPPSIVSGIVRLLQGHPSGVGPLPVSASAMLGHPPLPSPREPHAMVHLNVGGKPFATTVATLLSVPGTFFWELLGEGAGSGRGSQGSGQAAGGPSGGRAAGEGASGGLVRTPAGEVFIDRDAKVGSGQAGQREWWCGTVRPCLCAATSPTSGLVRIQVFKYVLEYLRAVNMGESFPPLPHDASGLAALAREAQFFGLPGLLDRIHHMSIVPQPNTRVVYDSIYLETGFNSIEGPSLKEMEQRKVVVMQQMNHVLHQKSLDGFYVAACDCGVNHRETSEAGTQHNLYYHILLCKVTLQPAQAGPSPMQPLQPMQPMQPMQSMQSMQAAALNAAAMQAGPRALGQMPGSLAMAASMQAGSAALPLPIPDTLQTHVRTA